MTVLHERPVTVWRAGSHSSESTRCFISEHGTGEERDGDPDAARTRRPPVSECPPAGSAGVGQLDNSPAPDPTGRLRAGFVL